MAPPRLLLASASPRRRELVRLLNLPFEALATDIDETPRPGETAPELVQRLSRAKAEAAHCGVTDATVIACDTDVELEGTILGKPGDAAEARRMLRALRGRMHSVYGGITLCDASGTRTLLVETRVWMRNYSDPEIEAYVATGDPMDKAAAYGVQHRIFRPVDRVEGCFANVMGLALCHLHNALAVAYELPEPCLLCHAHPDRDCTVAALIENGYTRPVEPRTEKSG